MNMNGYASKPRSSQNGLGVLKEDTNQYVAKKLCGHKNVRTFSVLVCRATLYEDAEYNQWAECLDCGEQMGIEDIPEEAEEEEGEVETLRGTPSEFYD